MVFQSRAVDAGLYPRRPGNIVNLQHLVQIVHVDGYRASRLRGRALCRGRWNCPRRRVSQRTPFPGTSAPTALCLPRSWDRPQRREGWETRTGRPAACRRKFTPVGVGRPVMSVGGANGFQARGRCNPGLPQVQVRVPGHRAGPPTVRPYCWDRERAASLRCASVGSVSSKPHAQKLFLAIAAILRNRNHPDYRCATKIITNPLV